MNDTTLPVIAVMVFAVLVLIRKLMTRHGIRLIPPPKPTEFEYVPEDIQQKMVLKALENETFPRQLYKIPRGIVEKAEELDLLEEGINYGDYQDYKFVMFYDYQINGTAYFGVLCFNEDYRLVRVISHLPNTYDREF